jgi:hypothetical protein
VETGTLAPVATSDALLNNIPSLVNSEDELILRGRIKSPADAISDYRSLFNDDWIASKDRAIMQAMVDGSPPWSDARDRQLGLFGRTNVNWGMLTQAQQEAEQPFNDILDSLDNFGIVPIKEGVMPAQEAAGMEAIIAEELHRVITQWDEFYFKWWLNAHYFTMWGVSFTMWDDTMDWRYRVLSMQEVKLPRGTKASIEKFDRIAVKDTMLASELYGKVEDPEAAKLLGWNREAVIAACKRAHPVPITTDDPQDLQAMWKDNAINSGNTNVVVEMVHTFVREVDGSVSHYISEYNAAIKENETTEFIYKSMGKYESMSCFINAYLYGVGTNGDLHSIRGNAYSLFSAAQAFNKLLCKMVDKTIDESNTYIQAEDEDAIGDLSIFPRGPYMQVSNRVSFVERTTPNVAMNLVPSISMMEKLFQVRSSGMAPRAASGMAEQGQKTKYELQRRDEMDGKLSSSVTNLFFRAWGHDYREIGKRLCNPDLMENYPGGKSAFEFRRRCVARGVPMEVLLYGLDWDNVQVNMGIGKGSTSERRAMLEQLNEYFPRLDQAGQRMLTRNQIASLVGYKVALQLVPMEEGTRPPMDLQIANNENQIMQLGGNAVLVVNQNHVVHVGAHLTVLMELNDLLANAEVELQDVIPQMQKIQGHITDHMAYISVEDQNYPDFKEALQQLNEVIVNGAKHIESEEMRAQEAAARGEQAPSTAGTPPGVFGQSVDARARLEEFKQKNLINLEMAKQKMVITDALAAQKIKHEQAKHELEMRKLRLKSNAAPQK